MTESEKMIRTLLIKWSHVVNAQNYENEEALIDEMNSMQTVVDSAWLYLQKNIKEGERRTKLPVQPCSEGGKPGWRWGQAGKCYVFKRGSAKGSKMAKAKAAKQGSAIKISQGY